MIGVAAGYSWAGVCELKQMWIDEEYRRLGYGRKLSNAFIAEAAMRGVRRIWVVSYDFQAPGMYAKRQALSALRSLQDGRKDTPISFSVKRWPMRISGRTEHRSDSWKSTEDSRTDVQGVKDGAGFHDVDAAVTPDISAPSGDRRAPH